MPKTVCKSKGKKRVIDRNSPKPQDVVCGYLRAQADQHSPSILSKASQRRYDQLSAEDKAHWLETNKAIIKKKEGQLRHAGWCNLFEQRNRNGAGPSTQQSPAPASPPRTPPPRRTATADARKFYPLRSQGSAKNNPQHPSRDGTASAKALWV